MANVNNKQGDLKAFLAPYLAKWYIFAISLIIFGILGYIYAKSRQKEYKVNANVYITQAGNSSMASFGSLDSLFDIGSDVDDEIFIIASHSAYRQVIKDLGINITHTVHKGFLRDEMVYKDYPIQVYPAPGICDTLRAAISFDVEVDANGKADISVCALKNIAKVEGEELPVTLNTSYGKFVVDKTVNYKPGEKLETSIFVRGYDAAAEDLDKDVKSSISNKRAHVIGLSIKTTTPKYGEDILNAIIAEYNRRGIENNNLQNQKTAAFIDSRLEILAKDLQTSEENIQNYKERTGLNDIRLESQYNYTLRGTIQQELAKVETKAEVLGMTLDFLSQPGNEYEVLPTSLDDTDGMQSAIATYNQLILRRMTLLQNAKGDNLALRQLTEQIDAMRESIRTAVEKALEGTNVAVENLSHQVHCTQADLNQIPSFEREITNLYRERSVKQELYIFLLKRREETAMFIANALPKAQVIDEAYTQVRPVSTSKKVIFLEFLILGIGIPFGILYLRNKLRDKFSTREEVESLTEIPILGEMCTDRSGNKLTALANPNGTPAELFRLMRTNLQFVLNDANDKVVLVTSTNPGEGKSFISVNIASSLAMLGKKVLLIGLDIRKPMLSEYLNLPESKGATQYLSMSDVSIEDIIMHEPVQPNMDIIAAGPIPPNPAELLTSTAVDELFAKLREMYDYIIVDTAPIGMVSDTFTLNRVADAVIYVTRINVTTLKDINFVNTIHKENRLKKLSLVVNGTNLRKGYGYGYGKKN